MGDITVDYDQMKEKVKDLKVLIVDVRNPDEIQSTGKIGDSINIPVADVSKFLNNSNELFQEKFGRALPNHEDPIIFHCQKGARALRAYESAVALGFKNAKYYPGSYSEWTSKN